jgi:hypothetical protein
MVDHPVKRAGGDRRRQESPAVKGIALGLANLLVVAIGVAGIDVVGILFVMLYGGIPAVALGALLGMLAGLTARRSRHWRALLLTLPALGLVAGLGTFFKLQAAIPVACVPTFIAALVLERWTRQTVAPPVPVATVQSLPM